MENKIRNVSDITYMSELILDTKPMTIKTESFVSSINSPEQLTFTVVP